MPETGRVRFSVSDQGTGISAGAKDKVFQPFFTTKSIGKGTGLGLPISYGIVKMHNGNIWFDSEPGVGTTFYVEIPMTRAGAAVKGAPQMSRQRAVDHPLRRRRPGLPRRPGRLLRQPGTHGAHRREQPRRLSTCWRPSPPTSSSST